jgi:hypothetical protein
MKIEYSKSTSDMLKLVGVVSMIIDHIGYLFFPEVTFLRIIGRLAFPIFAGGIVSGYQHTSDLKKYAFRLLIFGFVSQFPYQLVFNVSFLNVIFSFLVGLLLIYFFDKKNYIPFAVLALIALKIPIEYEWLGPATIFIFFFLKDKKQILFAYFVLICIFVVLKNQTTFLIYFYSFFGVLLVLYPKVLQTFKVPKLPRYFFYIFYPTHLLLFFLIKLVIN